MFRSLLEIDPVNGFRTHEAALPMNTSHDALRHHLSKAVDEAHGVTSNTEWNKRPYIHDVFPGHVVYQHEGQVYKRKYTVTQGAAGTDPTCKLGDPKKVHVAYVNNAEALSVALSESVNITVSEGDLTVRESVTFDDSVQIRESAGVTTVPVKLIAAGWGSMAYYPKEVLQRDGPNVYKKGTHMMWNHSTDTEEAERPEGDLSNLAAVLMKDAEWREDGPKGPGLYSEAKVFSDYSTQVAEKGAHIGVSINAAIKTHEGEVEGRTGRIADKFVYAYSVDFVTKAGAGGAPIVPVRESGGPQRSQEEDTMTEEQGRLLEADNTRMKGVVTALEAKLAELQQDQDRAVATATVAQVLTEAEIPFSQKLLTRACSNPKMKEGKVDADWIKAIVADFSEGYNGRVAGMGGGTGRTTESDAKKSNDRLKESFKELGLSDAAVEIAVGGGR